MIETVLDLMFIAFAVYGLTVFVKWKRVTEDVDAMLAALRKEMEEECHRK